MKILNIAFYKFVQLTDLAENRKLFREKCQALCLKGTLLLSSEGVNGTLGGEESQVREFQSFFNDQVAGAGIQYKESYSDHIPFKRMLVKLKKEIIPTGDPEIKPAILTSPRITAAELKLWLDENRDFELLDTRNEYEIAFGTFKKASHLNLKHFRHFGEKLATLPGDKKTKPLVMFCTGGIRCEKASVIALNNGFREVFQLEGGILKYFEECGGSHYEGGCFVFDQRVALDSQLNAIPGAHLPENSPPSEGSASG